MAGLYIKDIQSSATDFGKGSQRDLLDAITVADAKETPLFAAIPKGSQPINALFEYPVDKAETPGDNAQLDGTDLADGDYSNAQTNYDIISNRVQWFRRQAKIGKLAQTVQNQAGIKDKYAYAVSKKLQQVKRDAEVRLCAASVGQNTGNTLYYSAKQAQNASGVNSGNNANKTRGLGEFLNPGSDDTGMSSSYLTPATSHLGRYHNGSAWVGSEKNANAVTESEVETILQSIYEQTGRLQNLTLLCGPNLKKRFKDFTQTQFGSDGTTNVASGSTIRTYNADLADKRIISTVDVYEGDFGTLELLPSLWVHYAFTGDGTGTIDTDAASYNKGSGYILDMNMLELRFNQLPQVQELPDLGGGRRFACDMIAGLAVKNPLGMGSIIAK